MHISLVDSQTIKLAFRYAAPTVAYIKTLSGAEYDGKTKTWTCSLSNLRKLIDKFPYAMLENRDTVIAARLDMWRRWVHSHNAMGVWFGYDVDGETVTCAGPGVSPVFEECVAERSAILRQFLGDQMTLQNRPDAYRHGVPACMPSDGDRLIWTGIQNAAKAEERKAETIERVKAKRYQQKRTPVTAGVRSTKDGTMKTGFHPQNNTD